MTQLDRLFLDNRNALAPDSDLRKAIQPFSKNIDVRSIVDATLCDACNEFDAVLKIDLCAADLEKELQERLDLLERFRTKLRPFIERAMNARGSADRSWYTEAMEGR